MPISNPDSTQRDALERTIGARLLACSHDELRVIDAILSRLELGRDRYGHLVLQSDNRDWLREKSEELVDAAVYHACALISKQDTDRAELHAAAHCELAEAGHG